MPTPTSNKRWATRTLHEAEATARDILAQVKVDMPHPLWIPGSDNYLYAGLHAATILASVLEVVEHMERKS
jgi:hypothetical protein